MNTTSPVQNTNDRIALLQGDALEKLRTLPDKCVNTGITSPPYFNLRDYGIEGQMGLERTPEEYVANQVKVFREFRGTLRNDGTLWVVIGDSYAGSARGPAGKDGLQGGNKGSLDMGEVVPPYRGLPPKNLIGIPWMPAFALRADGWVLRQDVIWDKSNCCPESVTDRCTRSHEHVSLLTKSGRYQFDYGSIMERATDPVRLRNKNAEPGNAALGNGQDRFSPGERVWSSSRTGEADDYGWRRKRDVWRISSNKEIKEAHFATFPCELVKNCMLAGCPEGGVCLDMFAGSGTVGAVALQLNRSAVLIELNPSYCDIIERRLGCTRELAGV